MRNDDVSVNGGQSVNTFNKVQAYIDAEARGETNDDASTIITNFINDGQNTSDMKFHLDISGDRGEDDRNIILTSSGSNDDESVEIISGRQPLGPASLGSGRSGSSRRSNGSGSTYSDQENILGGISSKNGLDHVLKRLSQKVERDSEVERVLPSEMEWENKVGNLARMIDEEKGKSLQLAELERLLSQQYVKLQQDTVQCKWKSRVKDLEILLNERRRNKKKKLQILVGVLEDLKREKKEMNKYLVHMNEASKRAGRTTGGSKYSRKGRAPPAQTPASRSASRSGSRARSLRNPGKISDRSGSAPPTPLSTGS